MFPQNLIRIHIKKINPATGSPTTTMLRLHLSKVHNHNKYMLIYSNINSLLFILSDIIT